MILIDTTQPLQPIILTLTELTTIPGAKYLIVLLNDASRNSYEFYLPDNSSTAITRYDLFNIDTHEFDNMPYGYYSYSIYQQNQYGLITDVLDEPIEVGKLIIKGAKQAIQIISPVRTNDYLVYKNE